VAPLDARGLAFLLHEWLEVESLVQRPRFAEHSRETFDAALATAQAIALERFAPFNRRGDLEEPRLVDGRVELVPELKPALQAYIDAGFMAAEADAELGGLQLPVTVAKACSAWFSAANMGASGYSFLAVGNANLLREHGSPAQIDAFVRPILAGRYFGTMCLSEPQAGSSLSDIVTRAVPDGDSPLGPRYRLFGNKMWISAGDHELGENIVHLVLAKIPGADGRPVPGVKGISLFAVPKFLVEVAGQGADSQVRLAERNDVVVAGLNHKLGWRGTVNTLLNFGEGRHRPEGAAGAVGYLVGEPGRGLAAMFTMMNEARIGVGLSAAVLGMAGYRHALDYARGRPQGRPLTGAGKDATSPQVPIIEHADVRRMLLAQKAYGEGALALNLYCARLVDEHKTAPEAAARREAGLLLDILTPIAKSWPAQWCVEANSLAIQVLGGYGYTRDYPVEQYWRDNRLNMIHEGTHGIQALDLLGRKVLMDEGAAFRLLGARVQATIARAAAARHPDTRRWAGLLGQRVQRLAEVTRAVWAGGEPRLALANATVYLEAFGHVVLAWIWLELSLAASAHYREPDSDFYHGQWLACRYFFLYELPRVDAQLALLAACDDTTLNAQDAWF
jgi:alkylation response protein AidB-like acyl-CoA dehydrogenase